MKIREAVWRAIGGSKEFVNQQVLSSGQDERREGVKE